MIDISKNCTAINNSVSKYGKIGPWPKCDDDLKWYANEQRIRFYKIIPEFDKWPSLLRSHLVC